MENFDKDSERLAFLSPLREGWRVNHYRKDDVVFSQGATADAVFLIQKGRVQLTAVSQRGKEAVMAFLGPGDFFGEGCLAGQEECVTTARAFTECNIVRFERIAMACLLREQAAFAEMFTAHLLSRHIRTEEDLLDQYFNSSEKRLARVLLLLANFGKETPPDTAIPKITQKTLAEMVGTTRSRISFFLNRFRKLGFIEYDRGIRVNSALLNVIQRD
jgi:CRP/FNR family transcriptional regulator, cyclic AMP receptor protein